jgi:hypothetical protein
MCVGVGWMISACVGGQNKIKNKENRSKHRHL